MTSESTCDAPEPGSTQDSDDIRDAQTEQSVSDGRWQSAKLDGEFVYPRFEETFGRAIDRKSAPVLVAMLNRALQDVAFTTFAAKEYFHRPRPFERVQLRRVCGEVKPPKPEAHPMGGSSYPSGHSAYGWAVAVILARVAPERAEALMARAAEYAGSRVVCGVHFPSDVEAGEVIAAGVVGRLDTSPDFHADLARARVEYSAPFGLDLTAQDQSVKPGDDFYRYAEGHWLETQQIPADRARWGSFDQLTEEADERVRELIQKLPTDAPAGSIEQKVGDYYGAYMNEAACETLVGPAYRDRHGISEDGPVFW